VRQPGTDLDAALDDLVLGRGVARGRHALRVEGRDVTENLRAALARNGFSETTVREAPIEAGQRIPAFRVRNGVAEFGWIRWEIFTPRSRRKLFASERRDPDSGEWSVQINLGSPEKIWANTGLASTHDVDVVVPVAP
jgi:hypothetical protein